jgi:hypothetical protein
MTSSLVDVGTTSKHNMASHRNSRLYLGIVFMRNLYLMVRYRSRIDMDKNKTKFLMNIKYDPGCCSATKMECSWSHKSLFHSLEHTVGQCFSTAGPQPSTGPWHQLYRAHQRFSWKWSF